jgi:Ca2+-binding RTX toxin-like protein
MQLDSCFEDVIVQFFRLVGEILAQFLSDIGFDFRDFNFNELLSPLRYHEFIDNRTLTLTGQQIPGLQGTYRATDGIGFWDVGANISEADNFALFTGDNLRVDGQGQALAGTVTGLLRFMTIDNVGFGMVLLGTSVSALSVNRAALSESTADDRALLKQMLAGADRITGSAEADYAYGWTGNDKLYGNVGNDTLMGDAGNDLVRGGVGADKLYGGAGNDTLYGDSGADQLIGGHGTDFMFGGADSLRDVFVFNSRLESPNTAARDVIHNFTRNIDDISLSAIDANAAASGNQAFAWGGTKAGANAVWYTTADGNATVFADVNGDRVADFSVRVRGVTSLNASDFIL